MKKFKGTPGPWYWDEEGLGNKNHIVFGKGYPAEMTSKANKDLIAAAPELMEALRDLESRACIYVNTSKAKSAINKALGE